MTSESGGTMGNADFKINQAKYCSVCGKEVDNCECQDQAFTISVSLDKSLVRGLASIVNLLPKIQISSNRCTKCSHSADKCTC